eukprot:jgi/Psemu1/46342/gm1.46342_g
MQLAWFYLVWYMGTSAVGPIFKFSRNQASDNEIENLKDTVGTVTINRSTTLDLHSLSQYWKICESCATKMIFPLPPCARLIPKVFGYCNANKSGSDTWSKLLMSHAEYKNPSSKYIQSDIVALQSSKEFTTIHRMYQIATADKELQAYPLLRHYHNAANKRSSYKKKTLLCACNYLLGWDGTEAVSIHNVSDNLEGPVPVSNPPPAAQRQTWSLCLDIKVGATVTGRTPQRKIEE